MTSTECNIASPLEALAARLPDKRAILGLSRSWYGRRRYESISFHELERRVADLAGAFASLGAEKGTRVLVLLPPSFDYFTVVFALFRVGAIVIMLDPAMGRKKLLACVEEALPEWMIGVPKAGIARLLFPRAFASVKRQILLGRGVSSGSILAKVRRAGGSNRAPAAAPTEAGDTAAILYTSGSTGAPKGVAYTHGIFRAQLETIGAELGIGEADVDLAVFPLFSLFSLALGATVVVPDMNVTRPKEADPRRIVSQIEACGVTCAFGSPAFWPRIVGWLESHRARLDSMRRIFIAGAPVPVALLERLRAVTPPVAKIHTPYGATECLPITAPEMREILPVKEGARLGQGTYVGRPLPGCDVRVIRITDQPIDTWEEAERLPDGEIGEIVVSSPWVTRDYVARPDQTRLAKIHAPDRLWHRMGDVGWIDRRGGLWFCGRKTHRVQRGRHTMFTECVEEIINGHPAVQRCALVGVGESGNEAPVIVVESREWKDASMKERARIRGELLLLARSSPVSERVEDVLFHPRSLPVDPRHNAKIIREELRVWAEVHLGASRSDQSSMSPYAKSSKIPPV